MRLFQTFLKLAKIERMNAVAHSVFCKSEIAEMWDAVVEVAADFDPKRSLKTDDAAAPLDSIGAPWLKYFGWYRTHFSTADLKTTGPHR